MNVIAISPVAFANAFMAFQSDVPPCLNPTDDTPLALPLKVTEDFSGLSARMFRCHGKRVRLNRAALPMQTPRY